MQNHQPHHQRRPFGKHAAAVCGAGAVVSLIAAVGAPALATSCATVTACIFGQNTRGTNGSGIGADAGVYGISLKGDGVDGETTQKSTATHASSGVAGYDKSTSGTYNNGVFGLSSLGTGVHGTSGTGTGVYGNAVENNGVGVYGKAQYGGIGVFGYNSVYTEGPDGNGAGIGVLAESGGEYGNAIVASANGQGSAGFFSSTNGAAVEAESFNNYGSYIFEGINYNADNFVVSIDNSGNENLAGTLTQSGQPFVRTATSSGSTVVAYTPRTSSPALEDFGKAQLKNGTAYVALEPTFAATIDQHAEYMVFVTPQGDNNGLYVTAISPRGFAVRESRGGHSTLAFDYRIVAKPYDTNAARLAPTTRFSGLAHNPTIPKIPQRPPIPVHASQ